jgi:hypothetical protein
MSSFYTLVEFFNFDKINILVILNNAISSFQIDYLIIF